MTDQEKQLLKAELMKEIIAEINPPKEDVQGVLKTVRDKWFSADKKKRYSNPIMQGIFKNRYWQVWELTRKLTCYICGYDYVRQIEDTEFANYVADELCKMIYDLRVKYLENFYGKGTEAYSEKEGD